METLKNEFNLIDGTFKASETCELLSALFLNKVRFHNLKNFSHQERFGTPDIDAQKRIESLEATLENVLNFLKKHGSEAAFEIHADINIKLLSVSQESGQLFEQFA
jgi:hypothetical protein